MSSGGTSWTTWDITSIQLGDLFATLDFPNVRRGQFAVPELQPDHAEVLRIPLSNIESGAPLAFKVAHPSNSPMAYYAHPTQNARDEIFWAGHVTNSSLRVWHWPEASDVYAWRDVPIGTWPNDNQQHMTSITPDTKTG